ncbi:diadenosine tetraphosphate hydrolase, partial [Rhizobium johnstonii]
MVINSKPTCEKTASRRKRQEECPLKGFALDPRLESASVSIMVTGLCDLRLSKNARWPWLILVPSRAAINEIFE